MQIKKASDLDSIFGQDLAKVIKGLRKPFMKRLPFCVYLVDTKPPFYLNDGGMLHCFAIDMATKKVLGERYCGSADTAINHSEQFNETARAPNNHALVFVETIPGGNKHSWTLTVVSPDICKHIAT